MTSIEPYPTQADKSEAKKKRFFFVSDGKEEIVKAVDYTFIQPYGPGSLYNFGFGDFDPETDTIVDDANSNNGDMRQVFSTVLSTVPLFFATNPKDTIAVAGSDSGNDFARHCLTTCKNKRCNDFCKNVDRRINTYRYYIDKNRTALDQTYSFFGYTKDPVQVLPYEEGSIYDAVFICRKN